MVVEGSCVACFHKIFAKWKFLEEATLCNVVVVFGKLYKKNDRKATTCGLAFCYIIAIASGSMNWK